MLPIRTSVIAVVFACCHALAQPTALTSVFTYQADLADAGFPATGTYDVKFFLFDSLNGGTQVGSENCSNNVAVTDGRFTATLDFGAAFTGQQRFLEIWIRPDTGLACAANTGFTILGPRQPLNAAPNASFALSTLNATQLNGQPAAFYQNAANLTTGALPSGRLSGTYSGSLNLTNTSNILSGTGAALTALNASNLSTGTLSDARLSTNIARLDLAQVFSANKQFDGTVSIGAPAFSLTHLSIQSSLFRGIHIQHDLVSNGATALGINLGGGTGQTYGAVIVNQSSSNGATGVDVSASGSTGNSVAGRFRAYSDTGVGIESTALAAADLTRRTYGIIGRQRGGTGAVASPIGAGVLGDSDIGTGVAGFSGSYIGVWGYSQGNSGTAIGVYGDVLGANGWAGLFNGRVHMSSQLGIGSGTPAAPLHIYSAVTPPAGLATFNNGLLLGSSGDVGYKWIQSYNGPLALNPVGNNVGVGTSSPDNTLHVHRSSAGAVTGNTNAPLVVESSTSTYIQLLAPSGSESGVLFGRPSDIAHGGVIYSGSTLQFRTNGNVTRMNLDQNGNLSVMGMVNKGGGGFKIDHPLDPANRYLYHSFVESPDMMNIYNGNTLTNGDGYATITLPEWFDAVNKDFRYQLTIIDEADDSDVFLWAKVVKKIEDNRFTIRTSRGGVEVSWQVTGIRKDPFAEANRLPVDIDKEPENKGKYLHPEAIGQPVSASIGATNE